MGSKVYDSIEQIFGRQILWQQLHNVMTWCPNRKCCTQRSLKLIFLQKRTIVIVVPAKTTEPVAIFQIPTDVLAIRDSLGKTVNVGYNKYSFNVSTLLHVFLYVR